MATLLAIAAWLRLSNLGMLSLQVDEGVQGLAVEGWLRTGLPVLPSGAVYQRSIPFMGLQTLAAEWFGLGEFALRLPAALFGILAVVVTFALGRGLFDRRVGWAAAIFIALSAWEIELSRYGRFYTAFQACYCLAFLCLFKALANRSHRGLWATGLVAAAFAAIAFHELALILATCFLIPLLDRTSTTRIRMLSLLGLAGHVVCSIAYRRLAGPWLASKAPPSGLEPVFATEPAASPGLLQHLPSLQLPDLVFPQAAASAGWLGFLLIVTTALAASWFLAREHGRKEWARTAVLVLALGFAVVHQFMITALLLLAWLAWFATDLRLLLRRALWPQYASLGLSLVYWTLLVRDRLGPDWKAIALQLFGFPNVLQYFVYWFALGWPLFLASVTIAAMLLFQRYLRHTERAPLYVVAGLVLPIAGASAFSSYEESRYVFHLYPLLVVLFSWGLLRLADMLRAVVQPPQVRTVVFGTVLAIGLVASRDVGPLTLAPIIRDYGSPRDPMRSIISWKAYAGFHQDHAGPAGFVRSQATAGELVAGIGAPHQLIVDRYYTGRMDLMLGRPGDYSYQRRRDGRLVDRVTGAEVVFHPEELARRLEGNTGWLLGDDVMLRDDVAYLPREVQAAARSVARDVQFRGRDGVSFVARLP
jgi:hypothetical protein